MSSRHRPVLRELRAGRMVASHTRDEALLTLLETEAMTQKPDRDIEKDYPLPEFIDKLRRLADALESGRRFEIQIAGERISVPVRATFNIEHERGDGEEEIEFQIKWSAKS